MRVIVTGSDSGIGRSTAVLFAERFRARVGITWHEDEEGAHGTAREVEAKGGSAEVERLDLQDPAGSRAALEALMDRLGGIDVFVSNSGGGPTSPVLDLSWEDWRAVVQLNLDGAFLGAQLAARRMVADGVRGRIVFVTSVHEHAPLREAAAYCAAKHGLGGLVKVMALELAEHGITVNAVAPGETSTEMTGQEDEDPREHERPGIPAGRPGHADEIAGAIAFLASPDATYVTGQSLAVDGGMLLMAAMANQLAQ